MLMVLDPTVVLLIPAILLLMWAQHRVRSTFLKYSRVAARTGRTGASVAREILEASGVQDVAVEPVAGDLTDHYDPRAKVLRLSGAVYGGRSLSAVGIAAHEAGHALQDRFGYLPMNIRAGLLPLAQVGAGLASLVLILGIVLRSPAMMSVAIYMVLAYVAFTLVTLPVEFNASRRAIALLTERGIVTPDEAAHARKVLTAAALTYVAAAVMAITMLVRLLFLRGMFGGRD